MVEITAVQLKKEWFITVYSFPLNTSIALNYKDISAIKWKKLPGNSVMLYMSQIPLVNVHIYFCSGTNSHLVSFTLKFLFATTKFCVVFNVAMYNRLFTLLKEYGTVRQSFCFICSKEKYVKQSTLLFLRNAFP